MAISTGNFPKAMTGNTKKLAKGLASIADKAADAKMSKGQIKSDIATDKKLMKKAKK